MGTPRIEVQEIPFNSGRELDLEGDLMTHALDTWDSVVTTEEASQRQRAEQSFVEAIDVNTYRYLQ